MCAASPSVSAAPDEAPEPFGDRVARRVASRSSQLVLGLDPDPARLWPDAVSGVGGAGVSPADMAATAVVRHCDLVLDAVASECVAVKLQVACFERLGAPGWSALSAVADSARARGLLVIADAKRGDIAVTATAYAQAYFGQTQTPYGPVDGLGADAMTVNPLLGADSIAPLIDGARRNGGGIFVLVRTSNPGAADLQDRRLEGSGTVSERLAQMVAELGGPGVGRAGLADVGAVVGATASGLLDELRGHMPHAIMLVPGIGAQGGRVEDVTAAFTPNPAAGLVTSSRGIVGAHEHVRGTPADAARAEAARLRERAWALSG